MVRLLVVVPSDTDPPANNTDDAAFATRNNERVRVAVVTTDAVTIQPLWWDETSGNWYRDLDQEKEITASGLYIFDVAVLGPACYMLVTELAADATAELSYALVKTRYWG